MPWEIYRDDAFERALKGLRKRFPNAERDILDVFEVGHPARTDPYPKFEEKLWKGRVACSDARRSPQGGFRVVYYWDKTSPNWCCLGTVYFKPDCANLPDGDLNRLYVSVKARSTRFLERRRQEAQAQRDDPPGDG